MTEARVRAQAPKADVLSDAGVGPRVVRGVLQRAGGFVGANLLATVGAVILLRHLGVEGFGRYGTVLALVSIVYGVSDAGLSLTGVRELALQDDDAERRDVLAHVLGMRIALTGVGVGAAVVFALVAGYDRDLVLGTLIAGVGVFLGSVQAAMLLPLSIELRNGTIAVNEVLRQAFTVATFGVLVVVGAGLVPFFAAQVVAGVALIAMTPLLLSRHHLVAPRWGRERLRALAAVGLPVAIASVLGILYLRTLVILMSLLTSDAREVGYFVTSTRVVEMLAGVPFLLISVVLPVLSVAARDDRERLEYITARTTEALALGGVLLALVLWIAAKPVIVVLGGQQYDPAVPVLQIQCLASVTIFLAAAWNPALIGLGRTRELAASVGIGLLVVLVAGLILIPRLGADGAAIAAVVGDLAYAIAMFTALWRAGPGRKLDFRGLARVGAAALPAIGIGLIPGVPDVLLAVAAATLFLCLAVALRAVPSELAAGVGQLLRAVLRRGSARPGDS